MVSIMTTVLVSSQTLGYHLLEMYSFLICNYLKMFLKRHSLQVVRAAHSAVKGLKVTEAETAKGKNCVKAAIHMASESNG